MTRLSPDTHRTQALVFGLAMILCGNAWAFLDFLKSPSKLIMNQKQCTYMNQMQGEMLNGKFLHTTSQGLVLVVMSIEELDDNRVVATTGIGENRQQHVMDVRKTKSEVTASMTFPQRSILFLKCSL